RQARNRVVVARQRGALLEVKIPSGKKFIGGGTRGPVRNVWSRHSRNRLIKTVFSLLPRLQQSHNYAITLTYRQRCPKESKRDLHCFRVRLARRLAGLEWFVIWKMEFQQRGVVHYHLILNVQKEICLKDLRQYVSQSWAEIVDDPQLAITGTRVDAISLERVEQVLVYVVGHAVTKKKDYQNQAVHAQWTGRWWGVWNKPSISETVIPITFSESQKIKRQLAKIRPIRKNSAQSYWTYCDKSIFDKIVSLMRE
ncbi:MAG: hypothetical protein N2554_11340, partial [Fimbriimonadales bacterium]|nr:hypothetical protein [Fimbriimonadales bacterium]